MAEKTIACIVEKGESLYYEGKTHTAGATLQLPEANAKALVEAGKVKFKAEGK